MSRRVLGGRRLIRAVVAVVVAAAVVGCTTKRMVDVRGLSDVSGFAEEVEPGERVMVTTHDGRELEFEVIRVEPDALVGVSERVERDEIVALEVRHLEELRTAGAFGGGMVAVLIAMGIVIIAAAPAAILSASP